MGKVAFLFPGQGAQHVGMGADLAARYPVARETFAEAGRVLGYDLARVCRQGPAEELNRTEVTQPAVLTLSVAALRVLAEHGWLPDAVAGLSVGEYAALVAAGSLSFADAVRVVRERGRFMEEAVPGGRGAMAAVLGLAAAEVVALCAAVEEEARAGGLAVAELSPGEEPVLEAVNFNCPGQVVVSGHRSLVEAAAERARALGARRVIPLAVSGPFHTRLMAPAAERLARLLAEVEIRAPAVPVVSNVTARYATSADEIRRLLAEQVRRPVRWEESVRLLLAEGVETFVEAGPGSVLVGFLKRIDAAAGGRAVGVQDAAGVERLVALREVG